MKSTVMWIVLGGAIILFGGKANAWGGLFNRFSPEMLANMGYGTHGGGYNSFLQIQSNDSDIVFGPMKYFLEKSSANDQFQDDKFIFIRTKKTFNPSKLSKLLGFFFLNWRNLMQNEVYVDDESVMKDDPDPCYGRRCTSNEHCCSGSICVNIDGVVGSCLFMFGRKLGELCSKDMDCEAGLTCDSIGPNGGMICRAPMAIAKQYAEECSSSNECDITRGLCCQLQRRHRQAPRKVCSYFRDPLTCIGTVAVDKIKQEVQHTAGEKRISSAFKHGFN